MGRVYLSIVIPVYKTKDSFSKLIDGIVGQLSFLGDKEFEVIAVEDGCPQNSWGIIEEKSKSEKRLIGVKLSRNFGQHPAIKAGLEVSKGEFIVVMDGDNQDDPKYIKDLLSEANKGNEIVYTLKKNRKHGFIKSLLAKLFNNVLNLVSERKEDVKTLGLTGNYTIISSRVKSEFLKLGDYRFHYLMVLRWLGFKSSFIEVDHLARETGKSSYNPKRLIEHAITGITFSSEKLLRYNVYFGFTIALLAFIAGAFLFAQFLISGSISGTISLFTFGLFSLGVVLFVFGITGIYIGQIFSQVKQRQVYIVEKIIAQGKNDE